MTLSILSVTVVYTTYAGVYGASNMLTYSITWCLPGPFKINGVPLRRVNQRYVIATSTKIDVSGADVSSIDDTLFQRAKPSKAESGTEFFAKKDKTRQISDKQKSEQKRVDTPLIAIVKKTELLKSYLRSNFALSNHQAPHKLKF